MELPIFAVLFCAIPAVGYALGRLVRPPRRESTVAFKQAARVLTGRFQASIPSLTATIDGIQVAAILHGNDEQRGLETSIRAPAHASPRLLLLPRGVATTYGSLAGGQDVPIGDAELESHFMIKALDKAHVRALLTARVRQALLAAARYSFELRDGHAHASRLAWETDGEALVAAMRATAALARAGEDLYESWRVLAAELGATLPSGQVWPAAGLGFDLMVTGTPLRVECARRPPEREHWQVSVLAPATGRDMPVALHAELLDLRAEAGLEGAGVFIRWPGFEPDRAKLARAVALMAEWAGAGHAAAYR